MTDGNEAGDLVRLIYRSRNEIPPASFEQELGKVFLVARRNNKDKGVTGALMYYDNTFAQALEGPGDVVRALFTKIEADERHSAVEVTSDTPVESRVFARWAMANVGEHGDKDTPLIATSNGVGASEDWKTTPSRTPSSPCCATRREATAARTDGAGANREGGAAGGTEGRAMRETLTCPPRAVMKAAVATRPAKPEPPAPCPVSS